MTLNLKLPNRPVLKPAITVFGTGGAGGNAVNNMISQQLEGISFVIANTDAQAMENSLAQHRIQLGAQITQGLGAGSYPEVGRASAEEAQTEIMEAIKGSNMLFITAGMGGGTGTGAAPVVARLAREQGMLTVAVVTKPFHFEGGHRMRVAEAGLSELQKYVDTLIVIPNQNLFRVVDKNTTFSDAFKMADNVLMAGVRGVTDLMMMPGLINLDFADVRSVMSEMGRAMMGTGEASGDNRATLAAEAAISNPLLDNASMKGARGVLINITGGPDMTLFEVDEAANRIREEVDPDANIIFGSTFSKELEGKMRVSVVATGIEHEGQGLKSSTPYRAASAPLRERVSEPAKPMFPSAAQKPSAAEAKATLTPSEKPGVVATVVDPSYAQAAPLQQTTERPAWLRPEQAAPAAAAQKAKPKSLFSRMAAFAGFTDDEGPNYPQHAPQVAASAPSMFAPQQRPQASTPDQVPQQQQQQASFDDDLLEAPAYLRRRTAQ